MTEKKKISRRQLMGRFFAIFGIGAGTLAATGCLGPRGGARRVSRRTSRRVTRRRTRW